MATIKYEVIARAGTYKNRDGEEKTRWHKCGIVLENDKGLSMRIESLPVGFDGWLNLWEPKPKDSEQSESTRQSAKKDPARHFDDMKDDIPFS